MKVLEFIMKDKDDFFRNQAIASRLLYNKTLEILAESNSHTHQSIYHKISKEPEYMGLRSQVRQYTVMLACQSYKSYTSKCDFLANEEIKKHKEYSGKRNKRGLFQSVTGKLINADINGACNILKKTAIKNGWSSSIYESLFEWRHCHAALFNVMVKQ